MPAGTSHLARALALAAVALAAVLAASVGLAHVIYVYQAGVNFAAQTPVVWLKGPDASDVQLSITNNSNPIVSLTIPATNATEIYVYQALELQVNSVFGTSTPYLYVDSCAFTGSVSFKNVTILVYPITGSPSSPAGTIVITPSSSGCSASGSAALTPGAAYYIDFEVFPALPVPHATAGTSIGTLDVYFSVGNGTTAAVPAP